MNGENGNAAHGNYGDLHDGKQMSDKDDDHDDGGLESERP
jgi:hypothetical protein